MRLEIKKGEENIAKEIHGFQVIKTDVKVTVKVGEKTTTVKNAFKQIKTTEIELEEETFKLGKNMSMSIYNGKNELFYYNKFEGPTDENNEN